MSILQPYIDSGVLVVQSGETKFPEQVGTLRWDGDAAQARMDNILSSKYADKKVDAVLSPYDGISRGIIASLKQVGYYSADKPGPVVTGQDAELPSVKSILAGEQTSTVFKDTRLLAAKVAEMVDQLLTGQTVDVNDTKTYDNGIKVVPSYLLPVVSVDQGQRHQGAGRHRLLHRRRDRQLGASGRDYTRGCATAFGLAHPRFHIHCLRARGRRCCERRSARDARHHEGVPGRQGVEGRHLLRATGRDPRPCRRERGRQVDPHEGRLGCLPVRVVRRPVLLQGRGVPLPHHP